jgi:Kinetochore protein CHL4 like
MSTSTTSAGALAGPSALLPSYAPNTVSPCSPHARKLLTRLDKAELINLALSWLTSSSPAHLPPKLSRRPPRDREGGKAKAKEEQWAAFDLSEERKSRSLEDCITIWRKPMRDPRVPKIRAIDRILTVDWSEGLSFAMLAEVELAFIKGRRTARTWIAAKLEYAPGRREYS